MKKLLTLILLLLLSIMCFPVNTTEQATSNLNSLQKVSGGYLISDVDLITLANYIKKLDAENQNLKNQISMYDKILQEERKKTDEIIQKYETLLKTQSSQIDTLQKMQNNNNMNIIDKLFYIVSGVGIGQLFMYIAK